MNVETINPIIPMIKDFETEFYNELIKVIDPSKASEIMNNAQSKFMETIPLIPNVDRESPWLKNIIGVAYEIGMWEQLEQMGIPLAEISSITQNVLFKVTSHMPEQMKNMARTTMLSTEYSRCISEQSKTMDKSSNWEIDFVNPSGTDSFIVGLNIKSCPIITLCKRRNVERYAPYFCKNDYSTYSALDIALTRKQTIAEGAEYCDFRLSSKI